MRIPLLVAALAAAILSACAGGGFTSPRLPPGPVTSAESWEVGPIIDGVSKSVGVPVRPATHPLGLAIDIPHPTRDQGHVHYVTFNGGSLAGKTRLTLRYRVELAEGAELRAASPPNEVWGAMVTLHFQRCGDDWRAMPASLRKGSEVTEAHRWWASFATVAPLLAGDGEISASLADPRWSAVETSTAATNPAGFEAAKRETCRVGFTLGGGDGYGHGVYATGPARFIIKEFVIE